MYQRGDIGVFRAMYPRLAGIGAASVVSGYTIVLYYNVIIAWAIYYLFAAIFNKQMPWSEENYEISGSIELIDGVSTYYNNCPGMHIAEEYFAQKVVMVINDDCSDWDSEGSSTKFNTNVYLCVLFVWIFIYFTIWKGTDSTGQIVWITVPLPVVLLAVLLIKGLNLEGWKEGI